VRASSHGSVVPPGATSLRLMAELPGASLTLRSALAPPTDDGLRALRVAASVAADGGGALRRALYEGLASREEADADVSLVLLAYDDTTQAEAEALPLEGPSLGKDEPGMELGETYANLRAALREGDPLRKRLHLTSEEEGAPSVGSLTLTLQSLPLLKQLDATLRACNARRNVKDVLACEARRKAIAPPPAPAAQEAEAGAAAAPASPKFTPGGERRLSLDARLDAAPPPAPLPPVPERSSGLSLDSRLARHVRVILDLRVRAGARVAARLSVGPATAEEVLQTSQQKHGARLAAKQVASEATAAAAADGVAAGGARADAAEVRGDAGEVAEIVIEIEALELAAEQR